MAILERTYRLETLIFLDVVRAINNAATVVNLKRHFVCPHAETIIGIGK